MLEKGIIYGVKGGLDRLDAYVTTTGTETDSMDAQKGNLSRGTATNLGWRM